MIEYNKDNMSMNQNKNNLNVSNARDRSCETSLKNKQSLNKTFNKNFSRSIKVCFIF